jgi:hypothetical protein
MPKFSQTAKKLLLLKSAILFVSTIWLAKLQEPFYKVETTVILMAILVSTTIANGFDDMGILMQPIPR